MRRSVGGGLAALFFCWAVLCAALGIAPRAAWAGAAVIGDVGPQTVGTQLASGLTVVARKSGAAPLAALEFWVRCPANGYDGMQPGIARLAAFALADHKPPVGPSLRDAVRAAGGRLGISVYPEATQFSVVAPAYDMSNLLSALLGAVLHPAIDQASFESGRTRLAAVQVAAEEGVDQVLRDALFAQLFSAGPLHDSTYGNPISLRAMTLNAVAGFTTTAYVPGNEIVVVTGAIDPASVSQRVAQFGMPSGSRVPAMPASPQNQQAAAPRALHPLATGVTGIALGWTGPPISDERAATAMDFWSDYLTDPDSGVLVRAVRTADDGAAFSGQFITLRNPGVFFVAVSGQRLDTTAMAGVLRAAVANSVGHRMSDAQFVQARDAFVTHLLRTMQTDEALADNYGWYFAQGALSYSPSATGPDLSGDYFARVASLTPDYVLSVAKRYLMAAPSVVILPAGDQSSRGVSQ